MQWDERLADLPLYLKNYLSRPNPGEAATHDLSTLLVGNYGIRLAWLNIWYLWES